MSRDELKYWIAFNQIGSIGFHRLNRLLKYFESLKQAWQASKSELIQAGLEPKIAQEVIEKRDEANPEAELDRTIELGIKVTTLEDANYPKLLKETYSPPPLLYHYGELDLNNDFTLAVVGSRKMSIYGKQVTFDLVENLAQSGFTIVSGLAIGIDATAHQATLNVGGKTVSVLGSGLQKIYPVSNHLLAKNIIENGGTIVSEFPLDTPAFKSNFPQRNRIIAGLSLGTIITQAAKKSGALITARFAIEQNREVFAVPGSILEMGSQGPNNLIKLGAKCVTSAADVIESLNLSQINDFKATKRLLPANPLEEKIIKLLEQGEMDVDKLTKSARLDISTINSTLIVLEMKGLVKNLGANKYIKNV